LIAQHSRPIDFVVETAMRVPMYPQGSFSHEVIQIGYERRTCRLVLKLRGGRQIGGIVVCDHHRAARCPSPSTQFAHLHKWLMKDFKNPADRARYMSLPLDELLAGMPFYAHRLFQEFPKLDVIVHKAVPMDGQVITIGTFRVKPENIMSLQVRHRPDIQVEI